MKNGIRPASHKVISKLRAVDRQDSYKSDKQYPVKTVKQKPLHNQQPRVAVDTAACYNPDVLGISLAVGQRTLDPRAQVRILDPQPVFSIKPQEYYCNHPDNVDGPVLKYLYTLTNTFCLVCVESGTTDAF